MAKKLLHSYEFIPSTNTVIISGIYRLERFLLITNVTRNEIIFTFGSNTKGTLSYSINTALETTTLVLDQNCSSMSSSDKLQIFIEADDASFAPSETFIDPVSKFRVSQPENLIDTDFEYGLQSTKWETLEMVKNIPTFFSRNGDTALTVESMTIIQGSETVNVITTTEHGLIAGSPIIVQGTQNINCNGGFVVTSASTTTSFQYRAKSILNFTGSILDTYTQVFSGSVYQGTEFKLSNIASITTDSQAQSLLTVSTQFPTNFNVGTSFFLSNSISKSINDFDSTETIPENFNAVSLSTVNNASTGESGFSLGATQPYQYSGSDQVLYFTVNDITVNTVDETIQFSTAHGLADNTPYLYVVGEGNGAIGGLASYTGYYVRVVDTTTIYLTTAKNGTTRINLTSAGTNVGVMRSAFIQAYKAVSANTATASESINFEDPHGFTSGEDQPCLFFNGTSSNLTTSTNLISVFTVYYPKTVRSTTGVSWATTVNGTQIGLSSATANSFMIKVSLLSDRSSIYFANHGLTDNNVVIFGVTSGIPPTGLTNLTSYRIEFVNPNRVRLKVSSTGAVIRLTSVGTVDATFTLETRTPNLNNDSIFVPNSGLIDGTEVTYTNKGNTSIGGLVDGTAYYVFQKTQNRIKLASNSNLWKTDSRTVNQATGVNITTDVLTTTVAHGFTTGDAVQYLASAPISGLTNGAFYWARSVSATTLTLHWSNAGAVANNDLVDITGVSSGTGTFRSAYLVDITSASTGTHNVTGVGVGSSDGVYSLVENIDRTTFTLATPYAIPDRELIIDLPLEEIDLSRNAFYFENHFLSTGTPIIYFDSGDTAIEGLTQGNTYYAIRISRDWFKLAESVSEANEDIPVEITTIGTGAQTFTTSSVAGEILGPGTVSIADGSTVVVGQSTNFTASFNPGNILTVYKDPTVATKTITSVNTTSDIFTCVGHGLVDGDPVRMNSTTAPTGTTNNRIYYIRRSNTNTPTDEFTLHPTYANAIAGSNKVDVSSTGTSVRVDYLTSLGSTSMLELRYVNSQTGMILIDPVSESFTNVEYAVGTSLLVRADGFALHRPYDGGVELIPSSNPNSQMIRQTRKYFRYQSGKGIQVSFAVNFSPTTTIDTLRVVPGFLTATATTRNSHRLTVGLQITISGATGPDAEIWNGVYTITEIEDPQTFKFSLDSSPSESTASGIVEYYVNSWTNSLLKCGLFDDQNGLFFEYDGLQLYCCRRSSTLQISGVSSVEFKSGRVLGSNTQFSSQLVEGEMIVIKGQSYVIAEITSNTELYILPSYRGVTASNVVITKTVDTKIAQTDWSIDPCDGTGPLGYVLNVNSIQMAYMDYSWYGAGKVRFGFKNQNGQVVYVHEFIHNNIQTEAYMRSGNLPARYEIENTGIPTYVPALAHWGTSVIMDGRFDDDKAYVFTANSNTISVVGVATQTVSARVETQAQYNYFNGQRLIQIGYALLVATPNSAFNGISTGLPITGAGISVGTNTGLPISNQVSPRQPYLASIDTVIGSNFQTRAARTLLVIDRIPTTVAASASNYTVTVSAAVTPVVFDIPLISIRLSPSVDTNTPGLLGEREIINRMQLILQSVGILSTHSAEISLVLNGQLNTNAWQRVTNPSLSQLIYHSPSDNISGGTIVYSFRSQGGTGATARSAVVTTADLGEIATLGNSIMGGDGTFPNGPDVLTVVARLVEDPSTVTAGNPFNVSGRISWSESQA